VIHNVTTGAGQPEPFDGGDIHTGGQFQHTFGVVGTIRLHEITTTE
jgi:hypothetical protein